jgi:hypothetical protein
MALSTRVQQWREVARNNPDGFVQERLRIPNLMGQDVPFKYKWAQRKYAHAIKEAHKTGKPVRLLILKWRRAGITSAESARDYAYCYGTDNARLGIIAHQEERAKEILNNYKMYDQSLGAHYPELWLPKAKDNIFGLKFAQTNAQVLIGTAENPIKIRGDGIHWAHLSEWPHYYEKWVEVMKEVCPVVPPLAGSQIIAEGTGSMRGSAPYETWQESKLGRNEFTPLFLCWLEDPESAIPFKSIKERDELFERIREIEPRLAEKNKFYNLSPEQIHMSWQMYHYQSKNDFDYFCREFPYTEDEAWSSGSSSYFGAYELGKAKPEVPEYMFSFEQHMINHVFKDMGELKRLGNLDDYMVLPQLRVWNLPRKGGRYVIGSDSASGDYEGDYSAGYVIDMYTREMMASYHGRLRPDEAAHINVSLGRIYNNALLAPETNPAGGGMEALNCIQRLNYHNIYNWRIRDGKKGVAGSTKLGWWTHSRSRPLLLGELRKIFLDVVNGRIPDPGIFRDSAVLQEMRTFGVDPKTGIPRANANCNDDRVMALGIAHQVAADEVYLTDKDMIFAYHKFDAQRKPVTQEQLISRQKTPQEVLKSLMSPNSNFMKNKFEI